MNPALPPPPSTPADARRALIRAAGSAALGIGVLVLILAVVTKASLDVDALQALLQRAAWGPLVFAFILTTVAYLFIGARWRALIPPEPQPGSPGWTRPGTPGLTAALCSGFLLNYVVPGPFGEFGAAWFVNRRWGVPLSLALASGIAARVVGLTCAAILGVAAWALGDLPVPEGYESLIAAAAAVVAGISVVLLVLVAWPHGWHHLARWTRLAMLASIGEALEAMRSQGIRPFLHAAALSFAGHISVTIGIYIAAWSIGADPTPLGLLFTCTASTAGIVVLFALPGSQVGWDALFFALLVGASGLTVADALALTIFVRLQQFGIMGVGALSLGYFTRLGVHAETPSAEE